MENTDKIPNKNFNCSVCLKRDVCPYQEVTFNEMKQVSDLALTLTRVEINSVSCPNYYYDIKVR